MPNPIAFEVGHRYRSLAGEYRVAAVDGDWLTTRFDDGREVDVSAANAARAHLTVIVQDGVLEPDRLTHGCIGQPCGKICVKVRAEAL